MRVIFNGKEYRKNGRNGRALKNLCFDIFKQYLSLHENLSYKNLQDKFNKWHCNNNFVVLSKQDWEQKTEDSKSRYFEPLTYNSEQIYFTTQWGNNGGDCDNINNMISFAKEEGYDIDVIESSKSNEEKNFIQIKNIILYGAPGVGKTHNYKKLIALIEGKEFTERDIFDFVINNKDDEIEEGSIDGLFKIAKEEKRVEFVTFHQSYSYEDFIEGFRPNKEGKIEREDGIFKNIVNVAQKETQKNFYIVIDEINRGNISKIFGELITLIEEDKRDKYEVTLPYSKTKFKVPSNLYIIATMNSTDKSIATIDIALRRRFTFLKMKPNKDLVTNLDAKRFMQKANDYIKNKLSEDYMLGHSYFMGDIDLDFVKEYKIKPLLEEYFYADERSAQEIMQEIEDKRENI